MGGGVRQIAGLEIETGNEMRWIVDPSHAWLEVSLTDYPQALEYGTGYGYWNRERGLVYLEEDCEAPAFLGAFFEPYFSSGLPVVHFDEWSGRDRLARIPIGRAMAREALSV